MRSFKGVCCRILSRPIVALWGKPRLKGFIMKRKHDKNSG
ncbi:hypothetical protein HMPREF1418_00819 [Helicobacter pylori GAM260BSi]|uniref:Uncharacterized protein n=1 Tax=Helicobacter pylori GAM260BSi TaxID=1159046 RepID=M3QT28_HELPX|nr:hypothetical protein HMPREF1418_00819 [Helicobacter pylori GAM260BSi]